MYILTYTFQVPVQYFFSPLYISLSPHVVLMHVHKSRNGAEVVDPLVTSSRLVPLEWGTSLCVGFRMGNSAVGLVASICARKNGV